MSMTTGLTYHFRAFALTHSIYGWSDIAFLKKIGPSTNISAKILAVTIPVVLISLLQLDVIQASAWAFLLVANVNREQLSASNLFMGHFFLTHTSCT